MYKQNDGVKKRPSVAHALRNDMADMNPDKITELINRIKNTDYAGKAELIAAFTVTYCENGHRQSADEDAT